MASTEPRVAGLRSGDPRELGAYRIVGRLGEGGMGSVYLANAADGRAVALKVIRAELADNAEFRRRFRSEVERARQVPPFCTAEVLDADTEHEPPYLVVEYVDGPSLSDVVSQRGPLSPANLHGIALGVAVALTAIHGAGVIHRDLKPANVLLAPGSPKVIDFGIARAAAGSQADTRTDQVVGTVAYMAPERFGPDAGRSLTSAADVFAWGAVVAFAATGRTPFGGDMPAAVAIQIMTQPPDLEGLTGALRDLVERALAKDPAQRPTARELVDGLLTGGATAVARPAAFVQQPEVLAAAGIAATNIGGATTFLPAVSPPGPPLPPPPPLARPAVAPGYGGATVYVPQPRRTGTRFAIGALVLAVVLLAGAVAAIWTGKLGNVANPITSPSGATNPEPTAPGSPTPGSPKPGSPAPGSPLPSMSIGPTVGTGVVPSIDPAAVAFVQGPMSQHWSGREDTTVDATCAVTDTLTVTLRGAGVGSYRCPGINDTLTDFSVVTTVTLPNVNSCAGVWFRYTDGAGGYALLVCVDRYVVVSHVGGVVTPLITLFGDVTPTEVNKPIRVGIRTKGSLMWFFRDGKVSPQISDGRFTAGRVVLGVFSAGVFTTGTVVEPPYGAYFGNVAMWRVPTG